MSVRVPPETLLRARQQAAAAGVTLAVWIEHLIDERQVRRYVPRSR